MIESRENDPRDSEAEAGYFAVLPAAVLYDKSLPANAKLLYGTITSLTRKTGYCWASNKYLAELYGVEKSAVSNWIRVLSDAGYIKVEYLTTPGQADIQKRIIRLPKPKFSSKPPPAAVSENRESDSEGGSHIYEQGVVTPHEQGSHIYEQGSHKTGRGIVKEDQEIRSAAADPPETGKNSGGADPPEPEEAAAAEAASEFRREFKSLDGSLIFDQEFYPRARAFLDAQGLDSGYPAWLYELCKGKKPQNLAGYYYRVFFETRFAELYREAARSRSPPQRLIICPVCGAEHKARLTCPVCGLDAEYVNDPDRIEREKKLYAMPPEEKAAYIAGIMAAWRKTEEENHGRKKENLPGVRVHG